MRGWLWRAKSVMHYWDKDSDSLPLCGSFASRERQHGVVEPLAKDCCGKCRRRIKARRKKPIQERLFP